MEAATAPPASETEPGQEEETGLEGDQEPDEPQDEVVQLAVEGYEPLSKKVGGAKPTKAVLSLTKHEITIKDGQFPKGSRVRAVIEGVIDDVGEHDHRERRSNVVTATTKKHILTLEHIEVVRVGPEE